MNFILKTSHADCDCRRKYAAEMLLDSITEGFPTLQCTQAESEVPPGLYFDGQLVVSGEELEEVFKSASLYREIATGRVDDHNRFDETALDWNVCEPWIDLTAQQLAHKLSCDNRQRRASSSYFSVIVTHDVDHTTLLEPTSLAHGILRSVNPNAEHIPFLTAITPKALIRAYERLLEHEQSVGVKALYFMLAGPYGIGRFSSRSDIRWSSSREIVRLILQAGMTVGLHGSYVACDRDSYRKEKDRIEQVTGTQIDCHRNHYLRFDPVRTWKQLEAAGISYDFSVGFRQRVGFRAGCGRTYHPFDFIRNRPSGVICIPLIFMDTVLFSSDRDNKIRQLRCALEKVARIQGCVSLLFHVESFLIDPSVYAVFKDVLSICTDLGADLSGRIPSDAI